MSGLLTIQCLLLVIETFGKRTEARPCWYIRSFIVHLIYRSLSPGEGFDPTLTRLVSRLRKEPYVIVLDEPQRHEEVVCPPRICQGFLKELLSPLTTLAVSEWEGEVAKLEVSGERFYPV